MTLNQTNYCGWILLDFPKLNLTTVADICIKKIKIGEKHWFGKRHKYRCIDEDSLKLDIVGDLLFFSHYNLMNSYY